MKGNPTRAPHIEVYRDYDRVWVWICWSCHTHRVTVAESHAEALAAALDHCAKATR